MNHVVSAAIADPERLATLRVLPEFRKATLNMSLAWLSVDAAIARIRPWDRALLSDTAMILGSSYGELETTKDFLGTLAASGVARPLLFQNSLHNATLGFLTMRLGFTGTAMTLSNRHFTGEDSLATALDLLELGLCSVAIVTGVDALVADLHEALLRAYPPGTLLGGGAATVILSNDEGLERLGLRRLGLHPLGCLDAIDCHRQPREGASLPPGPYFDSDAIHRLVLALASRWASDPLPLTLELAKPDGTLSRIRIRKSPA